MMDGDWHKRCNGNSACLEARWRKSSWSQSNGHCAEARTVVGVVQVRDSKLGTSSPVLVFTPAEWAAFTAKIKAAR